MIALVTSASAQAPSIGARSCHAMAYVPSVAGVVSIGGARACGVNVVADSAVWKWDGTRWAAVGTALPSRREDALVSFDSRRRVLVLYGGRAASVVHRDTWELTGSAWQRRATASDSGPGPLEHGAMAFDERRGRTVVFGGGSRDGRTFNATWEWDGGTWRRSTARGPAARVGHSMAWSSADNAVVLYGGFNASGSFRDLWKWDGSSWTRLDSAGPAATEGPALVSTERGAVLVGSPVGAPTDATLGVWRWESPRWVRLDTGAAPAARVGQGLAYDSARRRLVLFGGYFPATNRSSTETWEFDGSAWRLVAGGSS